MPLPAPIVALTAALAKLPGVGPRSAERMALHLVQTELPVVQQLAQTIVTARERIRFCEICGALTERGWVPPMASPSRLALIMRIMPFAVSAVCVDDIELSPSESSSWYIIRCILAFLEATKCSCGRTKFDVSAQQNHTLKGVCLDFFIVQNHVFRVLKPEKRKLGQNVVSKRVLV